MGGRLSLERGGVLGVAMVLASAAAAAGAVPRFAQTNLVSDQAGQALLQDAHLVNPWGMSLNPGGVLWVSNNGTGTSTLYAGDTDSLHPLTINSLVVSIPGGVPTGQVLGGGATDFMVTDGVSSAPARFIFASESGNLTGWNPAVPPSTSAQLPVHIQNASNKGLASGLTGGASYLYAANFFADRIDVYDANWQPHFFGAGAFADPNVPAGYAPFNVQNLDGLLYVTYAMVGPDGDDVAGAGHGYVATFDLQGNLVNHLVSGGALDSPWGVALAPGSWGDLSGALLVGNFGNGWINAYDATSGAYLGALRDANGQPIAIDGLWGLQFGSATFGRAGALYFTAGPDGETHGLLGRLTVVPEPASVSLLGVGAALLLRRRRPINA